MFRKSKEKIGRYRENLANKIQYLRVAKGGEPIVRLFNLMMTAIDYDKESESTRNLTKEVGWRLGAGYRDYPKSTEAILEAALNYAELSLRQNKTMTMQEWRDAIFAIAISLETNKPSVEEKVKEMKETEEPKHVEKRLNPQIDKDMELIVQMKYKQLYTMEGIHVKRLTHNFQERYCRQIVCKADNLYEQKRWVEWLIERFKDVYPTKDTLQFLEEWDYQVATGRTLANTGGMTYEDINDALSQINGDLENIIGKDEEIAEAKRTREDRNMSQLKMPVAKKEVEDSWEEEEVCDENTEQLTNRQLIILMDLFLNKGFKSLGVNVSAYAKLLSRLSGHSTRSIRVKMTKGVDFDSPNVKKDVKILVELLKPISQEWAQKLQNLIS